jgi:TRAP-type C4-dicarboxylate transport system permease small subunit
VPADDAVTGPSMGTSSSKEVGLRNRVATILKFGIGFAFAASVLACVLKFFIRWIYSIPVSWPEAIALAFGICLCGEGVHLRYLSARAPRSEKIT